MKRIRLFNDKDQYTDKGLVTARDFSELVSPFIKKMLRRGYCRQDLQCILASTLTYDIVFTNMKIMSTKNDGTWKLKKNSRSKKKRASSN